MVEMIKRDLTAEFKERQSVQKIVQILEEVTSNPNDYDLHKTAQEIYDLAIGKNLCRYCGCDLEVEKEVYGYDTRHSCKGDK